MAQVIRSVHVEHEPVVLTHALPQPAPVEPAPPKPAPVVQAPPAPPPMDFAELQKQAFDDGYRDGYEKGAAEAKAEQAKQTERQAQEFARLLASAQQALAGQIEGAEDALVEIAFAAVCKLLGEGALTEAAARGLVREAMRGVLAKEGMVVRVAPADYAALAASPDPRVELVADERVALGGCIIETAGGTLDARLEVQLRHLLDTLTRSRHAQAE